MNSPENLINNNSKIISYLSGFIAFIVLVYVLVLLRQILIPFTFAVFLTFLFHPLLEYFSRYRIPKWLSIIFIVLVFLLLTYLLILLIISGFSDLPQKIQVYSAGISKFVAKTFRPFHISLKEITDMIGVNLSYIRPNKLFHRLFESGILTSAFSSLATVLFNFCTLLVFWILMISGKEQFEQRLKIAFDSKGDMISRSITNVDKQLQSYIFIKTLLSLLIGITATIILLFYNIDFAIMLGLLTFVLNFLPNIGALLASIVPVVISLMESGLGFKTISLAVLLTVTHNIIGNLLEPHLMGKQMDLSPVFVLFSLIFWGWVWGIAGMFLAVPIAAAVKIIFSNIEPLKPIALIMGTKSSAGIQAEFTEI